jgi:Ni/Co efflux regulator RcnB
MYKMLLASAACLALLTSTALADKDNGNGHRHDQGGPPANSQMAPASGGGGHDSNGGGDNGHHHDRGGPPANNQMTPATNTAGGGDNDHHRGGWRSDNGNGHSYRHANDRDNFGRDDRGRGDNGDHTGNAAWRSGGNNGWHGTGNSGWHGGNWRNDDAMWSRYHRSWTATHRYRWTRAYVRPAGWYYRRWAIGAFLPGLFFTQQYWIPDYAVFALDAPPPGTVWVRYGDDALLIDRYNGQVIQVVYGIFY